MKGIVIRRSCLVFLSLAACAGLGCSSSQSDGGEGGTGAGGRVGSGGAVGSGGTVATGGATGQGGAVQGSGGAGGGNTSASGGAGGVSATGGATGTGGTSAVGGTSGAAMSIFDGTTLSGWGMNPANSFSVSAADGAIASTGGKRGICYALNKYSFYRVIYSVRQVHPAGDNHSPGVLFFGTDPTKDALGGLMFALPESWGWDYRGGGSKGTGTPVQQVPNLNLKNWSRCELLVNAATGTAKAACAQPVGSKAVPVLTFTDSKIPNVANYFGILCHTGGQLDEYKDITIEVNPAVNDLITTK